MTRIVRVEASSYCGEGERERSRKDLNAEVRRCNTHVKVVSDETAWAEARRGTRATRRQRESSLLTPFRHVPFAFFFFLRIGRVTPRDTGTI